MKQSTSSQSATQQQEKAFRRKIATYTPCFISQCPIRERCLHWIANQYVDAQPFVCTSINPANPKVGSERCEMFRENKKVMMKRGLTQLYYDMPARIERSIRHALIARWGRKQYFEMRRGDRLITPEQQQDIIDICHCHGWEGPIVYDGEQEDLRW